MTINEFGISWDTNDLIQCKNAVRIALNQGVPPEHLLIMERYGVFGSLWVEAVIDEYFGE